MIHPILVDVNGTPGPEGTFDDETLIYRDKVLRRAMLKKYKAYGLREPVIRQLTDLGCKTMVFEVYDQSLAGHIVFVIEIAFAQFVKFALKASIGEKGERYYLPVGYWKIVSGTIPQNFFDEKKK